MGSTSVGKSALINRYVHNTFSNDYNPTIAQTFRYKTNLNDTDYSLTINDTAGLEQQSQLATKYIDESRGFVLVYSIADRKSFEVIQDVYMKLMDELNGKKSAIILLGNKTDLDSQRRVTADEGKKLAEDWGIKYVEASAKLGQRVSDVFTELLNMLRPRNDNNNAQRTNSNNNNNRSTNPANKPNNSTTNSNRQQAPAGNKSEKCVIS